MLCFIIQTAFLSFSTWHLYQAQRAHPAFHRLPDSVGHSLPAVLTELETFTAAQPGTNWLWEHAFSVIPSKCRGFSCSWKNHFGLSKPNRTKQHGIVHASAGLTETNCQGTTGMQVTAIEYGWKKKPSYLEHEKIKQNLIHLLFLLPN